MVFSVVTFTAAFCLNFFIGYSTSLKLQVHQALRNQCPLSAVCFALDQSSSIRSFYDQEVEFVNDIATGLDGRTVSVEYSAVGFSDKTNTINRGTKDLRAFKRAVQNSPPDFGGTNIRAGLEDCFRLVENAAGIRVIIVITDGISNTNPIPLAEQIKRTKDTYIFAVGIGSRVNTNVLRQVASGPGFLISTTFEGLPNRVAKIIDTLCDLDMSCKEAYEKCDFRFMGIRDLPTFNIDVRADKAFTPRIISVAPNERLGILNLNKIVPEFIFDDGTVSPITNFGRQKFTRTHFKPFQIPFTTGTGVGHETFQADQLSIAKGRCIRMHFTHYQTLFADTDIVMSNLNDVRRSENKCIVFRTAK